MMSARPPLTFLAGILRSIGNLRDFVGLGTVFLNFRVSERPVTVSSKFTFKFYLDLGADFPIAWRIAGQIGRSQCSILTRPRQAG